MESGPINTASMAFQIILDNRASNIEQTGAECSTQLIARSGWWYRRMVPKGWKDEIGGRIFSSRCEWGSWSAYRRFSDDETCAEYGNQLRWWKEWHPPRIGCMCSSWVRWWAWHNVWDERAWISIVLMKMMAPCAGERWHGWGQGELMWVRGRVTDEEYRREWGLVCENCLLCWTVLAQVRTESGGADESLFTRPCMATESVTAVF